VWVSPEVSDFFDFDRMSISKLRSVKKAAKQKIDTMSIFERLSD
jgi:hypothetical protein